MCSVVLCGAVRCGAVRCGAATWISVACYAPHVQIQRTSNQSTHSAAWLSPHSTHSRCFAPPLVVQRRASQVDGGLEDIETEVSRRIADAAAKINLRESVASRASSSQSPTRGGEGTEQRRRTDAGASFAVTFGDGGDHDDSRRASKSISFFSGLHTGASKAQPSGSGRSSASLRASPADMCVVPVVSSCDIRDQLLGSCCPRLTHTARTHAHTHTHTHRTHTRTHTHTHAHTHTHHTHAHTHTHTMHAMHA
jgi:hypothetical protein